MKLRSPLFIAFGFSILLFGFNQSNHEKIKEVSTIRLSDTATCKKQIALMLDSFNLAAANADYKQYFNFFTDDAIFIGTDATEYWNKKSFMIWAKPFFDQKQTWNFKSISRNIYFGKCSDIAWFDELLNTPMKICRGSGVVVKQNKQWKVQQYVLSATIPNSQMDAVIKMKTSIEDSIIAKFSEIK